MYEIFEQLLQKLSISAYKVCKDTGIPQSTISTWKTNRNKLSLEIAEKLAKYFGISIDQLMGIDTTSEIQPDSEIMKAVTVMTRKAEEHLTKEESERLAKIYTDTVEMYLKAKGISVDN